LYHFIYFYEKCCYIIHVGALLVFAHFLFTTVKCWFFRFYTAWKNLFK
jgi:hypothetical protein